LDGLLEDRTMKDRNKRFENQPAKPVVVVSAVNVVELGTLSVLKDALSVLSACYGRQYDLVAVVHRRDLFDLPGVRFLEYPSIKPSWLRRLKFEYFDLRKLSRELRPYLWLSMHDISPTVAAETQAVYCHNSSPFYRFRWRDLWLEWKVALFTLFYGSLVGINIKRNRWVIVQQDWMRREFRRRYGVDHIVVAHPETAAPQAPAPASEADEGGGRRYRFFYPCFPRSFKNVETLLRAAEIVERDSRLKFEVWLTFDGAENRYAAGLLRRFRSLRSAKFLGRLSREQVFKRYAEADCLVFASQLESWGMPISEFRPFQKPMLLADLPYAHETVGSHRQVAFFAPPDAQELAQLMKAAIEGEAPFGRVIASHIEPPYCRSWEELFKLLLAGSAEEAAAPHLQPYSAA
jgi:glycosyltransferase involved in cell wall biosynthesis